LENLKEKGRLQFFFHSPSSELPIRDVLNEQKRGHKTGPHIEIGAENFINCCYQSKNILPFLKSDEKYLFLFTTCRNENLKRFYNERYIIVFIIKKDYRYFPKTEKCEEKKCPVRGKCEGRYAVIGDAKIFKFEDAYPT